jgi:hypothetical protein
MLATKGIEAVHWTAVSDPRAPDEERLRYARERVRRVQIREPIAFHTIWPSCVRRRRARERNEIQEPAVETLDVGRRYARDAPTSSHVR